MTEQEAIEELKCYRAQSGTSYPEEIEVAIVALEEIQQYREIGFTPKMVREMIKSEQKATHYALIHDVMLKQYEEIGTPEECREAIEKQRAKEPIDRCMFSECPNCGNVEIQYCTYCTDCGQKLDWSEEDNR